MKGLLITNGFLRTNKFVEHYDWLADAASHFHCTLDLMTNDEVMIFYGREDECLERLKSYQFLIFWDKDIRLGRFLENITHILGITMYNSISSIGICDDKSETQRVLQNWNRTHPFEEQIPLIPTIMAPMTYPNVGYGNTEFVDHICEALGLPMIIKECFGSFGQQVYKADTKQEVLQLTKKLEGVPFLYQKYLVNSHGVDVRLQVVGQEVVASMKRYSVTEDFRANLSNGGIMENYQPSEAECQLAVNTIKALGLDFGGVDLLFSKGPVQEADTVCEVNSNAHFRNISECTGINVAQHIMKYVIARS